VMPHTDLAGACVFADRMRGLVEDSLGVTISGGVSMAVESDDPHSLLSRADAALYSAKSSGRNRVFQHTGIEIEPIECSTAGV
jgi:diguanylate cyclase